MPFSSDITLSIPGGVGSRQIVYGGYESTGGSTGGTIQTGLKTIEFVSLQNGSTPVSSTAVGTPSGGAVTITTAADASGVWMAIGY